MKTVAPDARFWQQLFHRDAAQSVQGQGRREGFNFHAGTKPSSKPSTSHGSSAMPMQSLPQILTLRLGSATAAASPLLRRGTGRKKKDDRNNKPIPGTVDKGTDRRPKTIRDTAMRYIYNARRKAAMDTESVLPVGYVRREADPRRKLFWSKADEAAYQRTACWTLETAKELVKHCNSVVRKRVGNKCGFACQRLVDGGAQPTEMVLCKGITDPLKDTLMPELPRRGTGSASVYSARGGSSSTRGRLVDKQIYHLINCLSSVGVNVMEFMSAIGPQDIQDLYKNGRNVGAVVPAMVWAGRNGLDKLCKKSENSCRMCGLGNSSDHESMQYARVVPNWDIWTLMYLQDLYLRRLHPIASQVRVAQGEFNLGTALDDLALNLDTGRLTLVERKTGYDNVVGRPTMQEINSIRVYAENEVLLDAPNTEHTLHLMQIAVTAELLHQTTRNILQIHERGLLAVSGDLLQRMVSLHRLEMDAFVVYVSGKSRARTVDRAEMNCNWLPATLSHMRVAHMVVPEIAKFNAKAWQKKQQTAAAGKQR